MRKIFVYALLGITCHVFSQFSINGKVKNENGEPLIGANVVIEGTYTGNVTDLNGNFEITGIQKGNYVLHVSYLGYEELKEIIQLTKNVTLEFTLRPSMVMAEEVIVKGIRATDKTPTTYSNISKEDIEKNNQGKDVPYLLALQPGVTVSSDAGAGIGYTSMRIRGVDSRQINVTINGIPLNDAESHGVYWVDIPDITGSTEAIQVQRGVGTSTNGAGAFGGSINLNTNNISKKATVELNGSYGSFNTSKFSVSTKSGLINDHFFLEGKYGQTKSDGYRDRSWSDLKSYFVQGGYLGKKTMLKLISFGGREETYQAWYSVTQDEIDFYGRTFNPAGIIYNEDWSIASYYDNFIDHYSQDHLQLHWAQELTPYLSLNTALHYTYGRGYYEEYMQEEFLQYYSLPYYGIDPLYIGSDTVSYSDLVRRLWLDNDFYGATWTVNYTQSNLNITLGGAYNVYADGQHFGEIIWARYAGNSLPGHEFYRNISEKSDFNSFLKANYQAFGALNIFADIQYRNIRYTAQGLNREWTDGEIDIDKSYSFFNPKLGILYSLNNQLDAYASYAIANREPNRSDFLDAPGGIEPKSEKLSDTEIGLKFRDSGVSAELVAYNMQYTNQLVLTGKLNDVGSPIRQNVGKSYRRGIEISALARLTSMLKVGGNVSLSSNKTSYKNFNEEDSTFTNLDNVSLAYAPEVIASGIISFSPLKNMETNLTCKLVDEQFVDNTENENLKLPSYSTVDLQLNYLLNIKNVSNIAVYVNIYNLLNTEYSSYGVSHWTGGIGLFPQAGTHFMTGLKITF